MQETRKDIVQFINLQLASLGQPTFKDKPENSIQFLDPKFEELTSSLIKSIQAKIEIIIEPSFSCRFKNTSIY